MLSSLPENCVRLISIPLHVSQIASPLPSFLHRPLVPCAWHCPSPAGSSMPFSSPASVGRMANGGATDYRIYVATSTGFLAFEDSAGQIAIYPAGRIQSIPADEAVRFAS